MANRPPPADPLQDLLDELAQIRARETEILVTISALLRAATPDGPPDPAAPVPRIRIAARDSDNNFVYRGDRVRFRGTARTRPGTGRVLSWTNNFIRIERDFPPGRRIVGSRLVTRHPNSVTLIERGPWHSLPES